ncbi:FAD-dependent monooxygenase [Salipiger mucosus]|uniref:Salicylate hydroxylase n=1 Tax=Salipiger mucosus DSM 16094 TaxID=1123237 RepID=S9QLG0_9RHOB|nr:FAD-dependent monooxygenase [Salipiger mucosus]EPX80438.1 Salicylate hydroxylase [Salipiger mucosus DSM 16094]
MTLQGRQTVVVGGGIGGLAAALALARRGAEVTVLEQAETISEVGAGLQFSPNGMRVIEALGLGAALRARACAAGAVSLRDYRRGSEVVRLDLGRLPLGWDYFFVHRADLIDMLAGSARAAGVRLRLLQKVSRVRPGKRVALELANGDACEADLVVGADGLHSVVRQGLNGVVAPFFTHQVAWRAVVPNVVDHPDEARVHMGPGRHVVSYPLREGRMVNLVAVEERRDWTAESWSQQDDPQNMRRAFAGFCEPVQRLMEAAERPGLWGLYRHPVARHWSAPGVAILGDAAHPTLPFMAQGANMALEDALVLAQCLEAEPDQEAALTRYRELRRDRCVRVVEAANGNAWKYHLRNPLVRGVAHLGMGALGRLAPDRLLHQFDWIYGYDAGHVL